MMVKISLDAVRYAPYGMRLTILNRDRNRCRYCLRDVTVEDANIDHVVAWKNGGATNLANLVTCCQRCNKAKGNANWKPKRLNAKREKPRGPQRPTSWDGLAVHEPTPYDLAVMAATKAKAVRPKKKNKGRKRK